jgi:hypothetical protein
MGKTIRIHPGTRRGRATLAGSSEGHAGRGNFSIHIQGATIQCYVYIPSANLQRRATWSTRCRCGERKRKEKRPIHFFCMRCKYTTCTHRPLKAKSRGAQQDPDATRCDDIVQCSAVHLRAVIKSRYSSAQAFYPILQQSTKVHVCYSHLLYYPAQDFIASPHVFPGRAFELHE